MNKTVLVTAIGSFSAQAVITGCHKLGMRVIGCDIYPAAWVVNSMEVDVFYQAPYATDRAAWREFLVRVCRREQVDYVMPLTDVEVDVLADWQSAAQELGALVCMSGPDTIHLCRDKARMAQFLTEKEICPVIPGWRLSELAGEAGAARQRENLPEGVGTAGQPVNPPEGAGTARPDSLHYPLVVKPVDGRSSQGLRIVESPRELSWTAELLADQADRYLVQEKLPGQVLTVDVVCQPDTGDCVCLPRREVLRTPNGAGVSVQVFRDPLLEARCRAVAEAAGIRGCVNMEFIQEGDTGERYFLECNPRFSGGVAFSVLAGYDMVKSHVSCFTGDRLEAMGEICSQYIARRYAEYQMEEGQSRRNAGRNITRNGQKDGSQDKEEEGNDQKA